MICAGFNLYNETWLAMSESERIKFLIEHAAILIRRARLLEIRIVVGDKLLTIRK